METPSWCGLGYRYSIFVLLLWEVPIELTGMQVALSYIALTTVLFLFPPQRLVTGSSMSALILIPLSIHCHTDSVDYCIVAFAIVVVISLLHWVIHGRRYFTGPREMTPIERRDSINHTQ